MYCKVQRDIKDLFFPGSLGFNLLNNLNNKILGLLQIVHQVCAENSWNSELEKFNENRKHVTVVKTLLFDFWMKLLYFFLNFVMKWKGTMILFLSLFEIWMLAFFSILCEIANNWDQSYMRNIQKLTGKNKGQYCNSRKCNFLFKLKFEITLKAHVSQVYAIF